MKVMPESAEYFLLALQCDKLLTSCDDKTIQEWGKDVVKKVVGRYLELEKEIELMDITNRKKKPRLPHDDFLRELIIAMGGVYKGHYHYEIPEGLPSPLHLNEVGKMLAKRAFEIQSYPRFLWGTGLVLSIIFFSFAIFVTTLTPTDIYSWILNGLFIFPLIFCLYKLREIATYKQAVLIMRERLARSKL